MYLEDDILYSFIEMYCLNHKIEFDLFDIDDVVKGATSNELTLYKKQMGKYPVLKPEEEVELFKRYKNGDLSAKEKLINSNLRLVFKFAANYLYSGIPFADLIQEGNIGLITAVERFDVDKDYKFSTYAFWWIRQAIKRAVDNQSSAVRIPVHMREKYSKFKKIWAIMSNELGRNPTAEEISKEMGISGREVKDLLNINLNCYSLNEKCGDDGNTELGELIADESFDLFDKIDDKILNSDIYELFKNTGLGDRQIYILSCRYGLFDSEEKTLEWIGQTLGLTRERVRQLEMKALAKLRNNPATKKFANYMDDPEAAIAFVNSCKGSVYGKDRYKKQTQDNKLSNEKEQKEVKKEKSNDLFEQKNRREEIMAKSRQNLYQLLPFDEKIINEVLKYLSEDEINHLKIRFGNDYKHPSDKLFTKEENNMFYGSIKQKMVRYATRLKNGEKVDKRNRKSNKNKNSDEVNKPEGKREGNKIDSPIINNIEENNNDEVSHINKNNDVNINANDNQNNVVNDNLSNNDFKFNLDISKIANNIKLNDLSPLQMTVLSLKLGQINGKIFTNDEISKFLGISVNEIIKITKTALESYRTYIIDLVNQEFDKVIYDDFNARVRSDK